MLTATGAALAAIFTAWCKGLMLFGRCGHFL
jgi:hypothetical protein